MLCYFKRLFIISLVLLVPLIYVAGCQEEALTGEALLEQASQNFKELESYRSDINMELTVMDMESSAEIKSTYLDDNNYFVEIEAFNMGEKEEIEGKFLVENGELEVYSQDDVISEDNLKELYEEMDFQYMEEILFIEDSEIEEIEVPEAFENGYEAFQVIPEDEEIIDLVKEEVKSLELLDFQPGLIEGEEIEELIENIIENMDIEVDLVIVVDVEKEQIVHTDMEIAQVMDMEYIAKEIGFQEIPGLDSEIEINMHFVTDYYDFNEPKELPDPKGF